MPVIYGTTIYPPKMSDEGHGSRTSIAHTHPAPKGENPKDYPQEGPPPLAVEQSVTAQRGLKNGLSHGSAAHGTNATMRSNLSSGLNIGPDNRGPKSESSSGRDRWSDAHKFTGKPG